MLNGGNENLLEKALALSEDVFLYYLPGYILGKGTTNSPFRQDKIPSFSVTYRYGKWKFIDWGTGIKGDVIDFIMELYGICFDDAVRKIVSDFNNTNSSGRGESHVVISYKSRKKERKIEVDINQRPYTPDEIIFWKSLNIDETILKKYKVFACKYLHINKHIILAEPFTFAFREDFKNQISYKIYQPRNPKFKWLNNHSFKVLQGFSQLPEKGDLLFIQKSLKDVMCLASLGYNAIAPQSENSFVKKNVLEDLRKRFSKIVIWYDNDVAGIREATKFSKEFNLPIFYLPIEEPKDPSDYILKYGINSLSLLLKSNNYNENL